LPYKGVIVWEKESILWNSHKWIFYFKDTYGLNILGFPFDGNYTISSQDTTMKFCLKKVNSFAQLNYIYNTKCDEKAFTHRINFSSQDSISWIFVYEYKVWTVWVNTIEVKNSNKSLITKKILGQAPKGLSLNYAYYNEILSLLQLWISSWMNQWYFLQERELSSEDGINFILGALQYTLSKSSDTEEKKKYEDKIVSLLKVKTDKYRYYTRWAFVQLLWDYFDHTYQWWESIDFRDIKDELKIDVKNILKNKTWNDYFGKTKYFQPNKKITRGEGAFLIYQVIQ
jgi:hypothetical protein